MIEEDWRIPFVEAKIIQVVRIIWRSKGFVLVSDNLYKRSASGILMKRITLEEV